MRIGTTGNVGIGTTTPRVALDVNGAVRAGSSVSVTTCGSGQANGEGSQRYNYTTHAMEYCNGSSWIALSSSASAASPSNITTTSFTASGTFTVPAGVTMLQVLLVGGGGAGAYAANTGSGGGGGGGGQIVRAILQTLRIRKKSNNGPLTSLTLGSRRSAFTTSQASVAYRALRYGWSTGRQSGSPFNLSLDSA